VLDFMEGKSARVVSNKEYLKVYGVVMAQCDQQDNGALLYSLFLKTLEEYINQIAHSYMRQQPKEQYLQAFVKIWTDYNMYAKLLDKMFDYLNRYFLKNQSMKSLGQTALVKYNELFYERIKVELREVILD